MIKVELQSGVWLADGDGDPARTLDEKNAKKFKSPPEACQALNEARKYRPFKEATLLEVF